MRRRKHQFRSFPSVVINKRDLEPKKIWVRKCDGKEFVLTSATEGGLRFKGFNCLFSHEHFQPKR